MAIVLDNQTNGGGADAVTSRTFSHTTGASLTNSIIFVRTMLWDAAGAGDVVTSVTYNALSCTSLGTSKHTSGQRRAYLHSRLAPTAGANNVVISTSASIHIGGGAATYSGVEQITPNVLNTGTSNSTTNPITVTIVKNPSWAIMSVGTDGGEPDAGTSTTELHSDPENSGMYHSNGNRVGSTTLDISVATGFNCGVLAAFAADNFTIGGGSKPTLLLLGVG